MAKVLVMCFLLLVVSTSQIMARNLGEISDQENHDTPKDPKRPDCITGPTPSPSTGGTPSHGGTTTPSIPSIGTPTTPSHGGGVGTPSTPSHGGGYSGPPTPSHGGGGAGTPSTPSHGGGYYGPPTPSHGGGAGTPSTPSHGGGGYYGPPTPAITYPPSIPIVTPVTPAPPLVPLSPYTPLVPITPPTPFLPVVPTPPLTPVPFDPNIGIPPFFSGTCNFWRTHPTIIWSLLGYLGNMGGLFGPLTASPFGQNLSVLDALSNTRTDGIGALFREGTAALLNSMVNTKFPFTTTQVRDSFLASVHSNAAAKKQANVFKKANEGRTKHN